MGVGVVAGVVVGVGVVGGWSWGWGLLGGGRGVGVVGGVFVALFAMKSPERGVAMRMGTHW